MPYESWSNPNVSAVTNLKDKVSGTIDMPIPNFNFSLIVEGIMHVPCKSVDPIVRENEFDNIQEGGVNDYVLMRRKPISKPFTFTVERYAMTYLSCYDPLQEGADLVLPLILLVTPFAGKIGVTRRAYVFTGCSVISKEYGNLNAEQSGLLTEKTTIGYRELMVVSVPPIIEKLAVKEWKFGTDYKGKNGSRRDNSDYAADTYALSKDSDKSGKNRGWAENPRKWGFKKDDKYVLGNEKRSATKDKDSTYALEKETPDTNGKLSNVNGGYEVNKNKWRFNKKTVTGVMPELSRKNEDGTTTKAATDIRKMAAKDESTYAIGAPVEKQINPAMWKFNNKDVDGNGMRRTKNKDTLSRNSLEKETSPQTDEAGNAIYANGGYAVNKTKWRFNQKDPVGFKPELNKTNSDGTVTKEATDIRRMAPKDVSTYAIGHPVAKKINESMWAFKGKNVDGNKMRRTKGKDEASTYAIGKPVAKKINKNMWRFKKLSVEGNGKQRMKGKDTISTYAIGKPVAKRINPKMWRFKKLSVEGNGKQRMKGKDKFSTYAIGKPVAKKINPQMWRFQNLSVEGNGKRRMKGKDKFSTYAIGKPVAKKINKNMWRFKKLSVEGNGKQRMKGKDTLSTYAIGKPVAKKLNPEMWSFNKLSVDGNGKLRMKGKDTFSTYAIGKPEGKKVNPSMWNIKKADENRRTEQQDTLSSYAIGKPERGKNNPEMWRFDEKKEAGNEKKSARPEVSRDYPNEQRRLWKFDKDNFKGSGQQSARTSFEIKNI